MCEGVISITHVAWTSRFQIVSQFYTAIQHVLFALLLLTLHYLKVECLHLLQLVIYSLMKQIFTFSSSSSIGNACVACLQDGHVTIFVVLLSALTSWRASFFLTFFDYTGLNEEALEES
ncbi:hypothetical protein BDF20DRAFT_854214, partial [Mycotypha africana]|uniref:uncharacterized protein n=1 Tax=Mycotypha africana TaxID=64632 RepID=UPI00230103BD